MGGVAIALPQDALSIVSNPAAGTLIGHRLDGGVEIFVPDRGAGIRGNAAGPDARFGGNGSNPFVLPEIGYVRPLSDRFAVGIAISGNGGMNTNYKANPSRASARPARPGSICSSCSCRRPCRRGSRPVTASAFRR
ncbi:outer membrane protein transport protein [Sphingomonas sp. WKB10]|nr:outer membrane protein transport protein [Sphingomonas sp. WKB10]